MNLDFLKEYEFFTGVPDSQLKPLCSWLMNEYGISKKHVIAANEGNAVGLAAGYHLATGKVPVVYMQNSGLGNVINPVASLLNDKVYAIPCVFVIGWRGEPNVHDEPQHVYQGEVTLKLLEDMDISAFVVTKETSVSEIKSVKTKFDELLSRGKQVAYVIKKGALSYDGKVKYSNDYEMSREQAISVITEYTQNDFIVSTTGKASRELFEIREKNNFGHGNDFLTVGSMGHSSSIALGIALNSNNRVWIIDGDGAVLMHMGSMAVMGANKPKNVVHVLINNLAHETVGGMPTVSNKTDFIQIALACGYERAVSVSGIKELKDALNSAKAEDKLSFIEVKCSLFSRDDLGRPTTTPIQNKTDFMKKLAK